MLNPKAQKVNRRTFFSATFLTTACFAANVQAQTGPAVRLQPDAVVALPANAGLAAVADGDFNHDGRRDLAVCERNLNQVALYMRSAAGTYPTAKYTYAVGQAPSGLVVFNRTPGQQYHADLMALSGPSSQWTMLRDDLDTTGFLVRRVLTPGFGTGAPSSRPVLIQTDINQDGNPDFAYTYPIVFNSFIGYQSYANDVASPGARRQYFTPHFNTTVNSSSNLAVADFDRDGFQDAVVADSANHAVYSAWRWLTQTTTLQNSGRGPVHTSAQDIDGDQIPDLAVAYAGSREVMVLRTTAGINYEFNRACSYALPAAPRRVLLADLNRDFRPELLVVTADNQLRVYQHDGTGTSLCYTSIPPVVLATGVNPDMLQIAYLDNDIYPDVVVGCPGDNTVRTYLNRTGSLTSSRSSQPLADVAVYPTPATDHVTISRAASGPLTAVLLDELGRPIRTQLLSKPVCSIATEDLPRGLYLLRLIGPTGTRTTRLVLQ
jgi:hypothetical protein